MNGTLAQNHNYSTSAKARPSGRRVLLLYFLALPCMLILVQAVFSCGIGRSPARLLPVFHFFLSFLILLNSRSIKQHRACGRRCAWRTAGVRSAWCGVRTADVVCGRRGVRSTKNAPVALVAVLQPCKSYFLL